MNIIYICMYIMTENLLKKPFFRLKVNYCLLKISYFVVIMFYLSSGLLVPSFRFDTSPLLRSK